MLENENSKKDNWDKFEIFSKFLGAVVLVFIPIVIKLGADSISGASHLCNEHKYLVEK
jgi:hypothetical protein